MDALAVGETYGAARDLLGRAEADAARIRADADRYRRQREQEAELLVAKARRLLAVAEQRAASIEAEATRRAEATVSQSATSEPPAIEPIDAAAGRTSGDLVAPTGLDRMLRSAITRACDTSFHLGA